MVERMDVERVASAEKGVDEFPRFRAGEGAKER